MDYLEIPLTTDPQALYDDMLATVRAFFPGWQPAPASLEAVLFESQARTAAQLRDVASAVPTAVFRYFGASLLGLPPVAGAPAITLTTWTMRDSAGYTVPAGALVGIRSAGDELVPFRVTEAVTVAPGSTATAAGAVTIAALTPGSASNGLGAVGAVAEPIDLLDFVTTVTLTAATSGGADAETDSDYLDRLATRLQLLSDRPILPADFAILALDIPSVGRSLAIDLYNPLDNTTTNERTVAVYVTDAAGEDVAGAVLTQVDTYLQGLREVNFIVRVARPTYHNVDVTYTVKALANYEVADLGARIDAALASSLSPANWGLPQFGDQQTWRNVTIVRYLEVAQTINTVEGVDYITALTIGLDAGAQTAADHTMSGKVTLPHPGAISGTVTP